MSVARRFAAALAVVGAGVLAYAVPASATGDDAGGKDDLTCVQLDGSVKSGLEWDMDPDAGTAWVRSKSPLCEDLQVILSVYEVPADWDGSAFPGGKAEGTPEGEGLAVPQTALDHATATVAKGPKGTKPVELEVPLPECGNLQIDLYIGEPLGGLIENVDAAGHPGHRLLAGVLGSIVDEAGKPVVCKPEEPAPNPGTSPPAKPSPKPSKPAPPTQGLGAPVPVVPPQASPTPAPQLAETGSDSTVPLLGLGIALLGAGIGLSLVGRRRSA